MVRSKLIKQIEMSFEDNQILFQWTLFYAEASDYKNPADKQTKNLGVTFGLKLRRFISQKQEVLREKDVLRNFVKFTEKHLCQSLFYNKCAGLRPATLLKKRLYCMCFSVDFAKFLRTTHRISLCYLLLTSKVRDCLHSIMNLRGVFRTMLKI